MNANTSLLSTASQPAVLAVSVAHTRPSVRYTSSQLHPSATEIDRCRHDIHARMPQVAIGALHQFLYDLFAEDDLVKAYFLHVGAATEAGHAPTMPLDLSERAADRAGQYGGLMHRHERELAAVAAFVQSCCYYWCARQQALGGHLVPVAVSPRTYRSRIAVAQRELLQEPLRQLRRSHPELGSTLAQVLGMDCDGDVDPQQVARIQAALGTAQMQVH
ncbi:hypothetical protein [Acidovorax temperans]|uniref:hypothetical protein n=1 Tax=Acidovorax temperans TaxID=80878 RepID=UPI001A94E5F1|nr:hypothetical protein [Acidovorax temperans]MBO0944255.1 hypothetical protein [Acidovorax temperans]WCT24860.1 hypothetical protein PQV96_01965 [Acidovorax temperans]